ncbi:MAG: type II toxin-antitoxin system VapB family antitoxin [Deltaproteobacteria bacterium]|nr:type II toxin-antitoxin system VapB family antitoxin [Deltaproteobacteria bacterium]MBI3294108.1 type II toxin-antitoxin system VapB family antitoxin [Deltaproteobacteria bacterium]
MKTTIILKDDLIEKARELTQIQEKTALIHEGLRALIEKASAKRLAALGGSQPKLKIPPRRRA